MARMPSFPALGGGGAPPKLPADALPKKPRRGDVKPRLRARHLSTQGKSAFGAPGAAMANSDPGAQGVPGAPFSAGLGGGGSDTPMAPPAGGEM